VKRRLILPLLVGFLLILALVGCGKTQYPFNEAIDSIHKIEIVEAEYSTKYTVLVTLSKEETDSFLDQFQLIGFGSYILGDPSVVDGLAVKITYTSGNYEMISSFWSEYVTGSRIHFVRKHCNAEELDSLLNRYLE
jgi:hypothetical protein